jgi:glycerol-3-phosphate dehydrogenase subunit B
VILIDGGSGASTLWTGAIDDLPWERLAVAVAVPLPPELRSILDALDAFVVGDAATAVVTSAGLVRPARGRDAALLDATLAASGPVAVVRALRPGWDADALAQAWGAAFVPIDAAILRTTDEERIPDADFASRHDEDARLGWLAARLREGLARAGGAGGRCAAVALPPCLGVARSRSVALSGRVGLPCGEAMGSPGGPAGLRFEAARDRALAAAGVRRTFARATRVEAAPGTGWRVHFEDGPAIDARAVVLATGGLLGGGLEYLPAEVTLATALPPGSRLPLRATVDAPVVLGERGRPLALPSSLFGAAPETIAAPFVASPLLERAGVLVGPGGAVAPGPAAESATGLYAAGELVADAPRTWWAALAEGCRAGAAAARQAVSAPATRRADEATANLP